MSGVLLEIVMMLHFDYSNVLNPGAEATDPTDLGAWHPVVLALVSLSETCGYREITEKNLRKVTTRIMELQAATGACVEFQGEWVYIAPSDVERYVGLRTTARTMTDKQWRTRLGSIAAEGGRLLTNKLNRRESAVEYIGRYS